MAIPRYDGSTSTTNESKGSGRSRQRDGYPFLTWKDIGVGNRFNGKILSVKIQPDNFKPSQSSVSCKVAVGGNIFLYTLRINNPNLETLTEAWGSNEVDWVDKKVIWSVEEQEHDGRHNIRVEPEQAPAAAEEGGRRGRRS